MTDKFSEFINGNHLCDEQQEIILAVSGGIDSVVMTDLFYRSGFTCRILHCNFGLRGHESDGDEAFVRSIAAGYEMPVYVKRFDTEDYAVENGISIQMAARNLRYAWFGEMAGELDAKVIATAHNLNDSVETVLLNLSRGTGIRGLSGIPVINGIYIRPLLFATRREIAGYARNRSLQYREDSSNASRKYHRNKVRHDLIPMFEELNPAFVQTMHENIRRFRESHMIYREQVNKKRDELFLVKDDYTEIAVSDIGQLHPLASWLYELFSTYGFTMDQCLQVEKILDADSGKQFISPTHRLLKDRDRLLIYPVEENTVKRYYIDSPDSHAALPFPMDMEVIDRETVDEFSGSRQVAYLDLDKLNFPLILRKWMHGDYFYPLGMEEMKKVSDFFIDNKIPLPEKKQTWILTSGNKIVWIMGLRIDHRFRVTDQTSRVFRLQLYDK